MTSSFRRVCVVLRIRKVRVGDGGSRWWECSAGPQSERGGVGAVQRLLGKNGLVMSDHSIVSDWLRTLGLSQYAESFVDNGYDDLEICKQIGDADLDAIGVSDPKHRERVLQAVRVLLEQGGTSVYFTLEEAARHSRVIADVADDDYLANKAAASARPESLHYFTDAYEEGKAELVRFPKMQLKMLIRDKMVRDGIRLSAVPFTNPDGSRGNLEQLAIRYAEELRTHYHDVLDRLEELRRRRVAIDFPPILDDTDGSGIKPPQYYRPGKYMPSSCLQEPEDDPPYGVYGLPLRAGPGTASPQRCLSPRSKLFYEPCPLNMADGGDGMDTARGKKGGLSRLFRTLGSKKEKFKTSPRHIARLKSAGKAAEAPARTNDGACLPTLQPGDVLLGDEHCVQLMLAVRDGHLTMEQAVQRLRQRDTLRLRNHKNRDEMLNEFARSLMWSQTANKKAQPNSIFYTDGLNIPACAGLHEQQQHAPIYYEPPPDTSPDVGGLPAHSRRVCGACVTAPTASSALDQQRFCTTLPRNTVNSVTASPFKAPPSTPLQLLSTSSTTTYSKSATPEVCDGNCGNIMCSVRAAADSSPSPPAEGTTVLDEIESTSCCAPEEAEDVAAQPPSRTVPDVAHESELKRAAAAAAAEGSESSRDEASGAATPPQQQPGATARSAKSAGMLGRLRSITSRSSYTSEEGQSQSSDYEDQEDMEKQVAESQQSEDQQRNSFVGRVKHLHKDVKKKISKFRNSRNSVDGSITDEKDAVEEGLQPGSSVESIPSGSAGSRSSLQAHTPSSSNRSSSSIGEEECTQCVGPIVGRARALVDNTPSPYDKDGLPFKKGDIIDILSKNTTGTWVGMVNKKVGHFKFITVEEIPDESKPRQRKFPSVPKLDHRPETLEELLQTFGLQNYLNVLMLHGYQDLDVFKEIVKEDLDSLGITNHEHQLLIFQLAEMLLDYDGENLGEYTEVSASPVPDPQVSSASTEETRFNNLDGGAQEVPVPSDCTVRHDGIDPVVNSSETLRYEPNIPVVEVQSEESRSVVVEDGHEGQNGSVADVSEAEDETSANGIGKEAPRPIPRTFHQDFRRMSKGDEPCSDGRLSESPARIPYGSSFARKVRSSTLPRKDSEGANDERTASRGLQDAKSTQRLPSMSLGACIEHKLAAEGIDLCQEPYTDVSGFCGIPPALVQRYSEELQKDVADVARALDQVRICELCERGRHGVPNDFLADSCHGPIFDADYSSLHNWLVSLGLPMYEPLFAEARVLDLSQVAEMRETDFRAVGITNARHVRLLSSAVGAMHLSHANYR